MNIAFSTIRLLLRLFFGSFYVSSTLQFRAFYESAETGRPHARCRCFVREDQTDGRAKEEGHHGKREIFQTQVRRVCLSVCKFVSLCAMCSAVLCCAVSFVQCLSCSGRSLLDESFSRLLTANLLHLPASSLFQLSARSPLSTRSTWRSAT